MGRDRSLSVLAAAVTALVLLHPLDASATRIDIDAPSLLGDVLFRQDLGFHEPSSAVIAEVRYAAGIYSYIYAVQTSPYIPDEGNRLLSFAVGGHPLEETWGAIRNIDPAWCCDGFQPSANPVVSITPFDGDGETPARAGFIAIPGPHDVSSFTVVYMQSPLPPGPLGTLIYNAQGCHSRYLPDCVPVYSTRQVQDVFVPVPEPGSLALFGLGLAALAAHRRASARRLGGPNG